MPYFVTPRFLVPFVLLTMLGCEGELVGTRPADTGPRMDGQVLDAGRDAASDDAGLDGSQSDMRMPPADAGNDSAFDGGVDAGDDAGFDAGFDAGQDTGPARTLKIICIGDSISEGTAASTTYRSYLYHALIAAGHRIDFVGPNRGTCGNINAGADGDWDADHASFYSARAAEILDGSMPVNACSPAGSGNVRNWAPTYMPDIAVIHLGTNDCRGGASAAQIQGSLAGIIAELRGAVPGVKVVVAQIIPSRQSAPTACVRSLNTSLPAWVSGISTATSPVVLVDQADGWDVNGFQRDDFHPNAVGASRMADRFLPAVQAFF